MALHALLGEFPLAVTPQGVEHLAQCGQQRLQLGEEVGAVTALAVGQAEHAEQLAVSVNRQPGKCQQRRVSGR